MIFTWHFCFASLYFGYNNIIENTRFLSSLSAAKDIAFHFPVFMLYCEHGTVAKRSTARDQRGLTVKTGIHKHSRFPLFFV